MPAAKSAAGKEAGAAKTAVTGGGVLRVFLARGAGVIEIENGVMDDFAIAGAEFDGGDVFVFGGIDRDDEAAIDVAAFGGDGVGVLHFDDEIRLAELPAVLEDRRARQIGGGTFERALIRPLLERGDLGIGEMTRALEFAETGFGFPRRHEAVLRHAHDLLGALPHVVEVHQRKWCDFTFVVAGGAVLEDKGGDVLVESDRAGGGGGVRCASAGGEQQRQCGDTGQESIESAHYRGPQPGQFVVFRHSVP